MPIQPAVLTDYRPSEDKTKIPLQLWVDLQTSFVCKDIESGQCDLSFDRIKALYTAALNAQNAQDNDIWESDGNIYVRRKNKSGDDVLIEIKFERRKTLLVAIQLLRKHSVSTFELSRFFDGNKSPENGVWHAIHEINKELNQYGYFVEISQKGVYTMVKS